MKPPSDYGYTSNDREWWEIAIRSYYREARMRLRWLREWSLRLATLMSWTRNPPRYRILACIDGIFDAIESARQWRDQARFMRRSMRVRFPA